MGDVNRIKGHQPGIAVDAAARIPAAGLRIVVQAHRQSVLRPELQLVSQLDAPGTVAVGPASDLFPVEIDRAVAHRTVNIEKDPLPLVRLWHGELLPIPTDAEAGELSRVTRQIDLERPPDAPVVG